MVLYKINLFQGDPGQTVRPLLQARRPGVSDDHTWGGGVRHPGVGGPGVLMLTDVAMTNGNGLYCYYSENRTETRGHLSETPGAPEEPRGRTQLSEKFRTASGTHGNAWQWLQTAPPSAESQICGLVIRLLQVICIIKTTKGSACPGDWRRVEVCTSYEGASI